MESQATKQYQLANDRVRQEELILEHLDFAKRIHGSVVVNLPDHIDEENLSSAGIVGLIEAARTYDPGREVSFKTYAYPRIRGAIVDELRRCSPLSQRLLSRISQIRALTRSTPEPMTPERIAEQIGMSIEEVEECLVAMQLTNTRSLEATGEFSDAHSKFDDPGAQLERKEQLTKLAEYIQQLPERERLVLTMYHKEEMFLKEIGQVLGISESRVSRILSKAQFRLKEMFQKDNS